MSDHDAIEAVNAVLDEWYAGRTLTQIARISGMNKIEHEEQK